MDTVTPEIEPDSDRTGVRVLDVDSDEDARLALRRSLLVQREALADAQLASATKALRWARYALASGTLVLVLNLAELLWKLLRSTP